MGKETEKEKKDLSKKYKRWDFALTIMLICLIGIFALTILNRLQIFTGVFMYLLQGLLFAIMVVGLVLGVRKNKKQHNVQ